MRFFCNQPDIIEDVQPVRYNTKSNAVASFFPVSSRGTRSYRSGSKSAVGAPTTGAGHDATIVSPKSNRSRTSLGGGAKRLFTGDSKKSGGLSISGPIVSPVLTSPPTRAFDEQQLVPLPSGMNYLQSSPPPMIVSTIPTVVNADAKAPLPMHYPPRPQHQLPTLPPIDKSKSIDLGTVTDSDREGIAKVLRRKSKRMSAPLMAFGNAMGVGSGTDTDATARRKRVSKGMIGAPEGFKHEGHIGIDYQTDVAATKEQAHRDPRDASDVPELWSVEAWRAEIERTLSSATTPPSKSSRPKGPRPTSNGGDQPGSPQEGLRTRTRRSVDGAARRSVEGHGGNSGAMTDVPLGMNVAVRPSTSPQQGQARSRSGSGGSTQQQRRSRSGSLSQSAHGHQTGSLGRSSGHAHAHSNGNTPGHSHSLSQPNATTNNGHGHTQGKGSINSIASTFSAPTSISNTVMTPSTTNTSLNRSLSDKPHHPHHYHAHSLSGGHQYNSAHGQPYHYYPAGNGTYHGSLGHTGILQRSTSATATLPPSSTSSSATAASFASTTSTVTAFGGNGAGLARKPMPSQRRKPVPQHLPATAEVSPFPTLLVVGKDGNAVAAAAAATADVGGRKGGGERGPFPFDIDVRQGVRRSSQDREDDSARGERPPLVPEKRIKKEMVPLLGVPGDEAHYVTKSTKAKWDGAMAEIAHALREPNAQPS